MSPLTSWSNRIKMDLWLPIYLFLAVVPSVSQGARSSCPHDLENSVNDCFTSYSLNSQSLNNSPRKLCCGVDVETLRAFCHSYTYALSCVQRLKRVCQPSDQHTIDRTLVSLEGEAKSGLMDLCKDDSVVESYAMYQSCFELVGEHSEKCFTSHLKESSSIRFLSKVNTKHKETFCRNMRDTVSCVQTHVKNACGSKKVAELVVLLVRPMVRDSYECDYSVVDDDIMSKSKNNGRASYISDDSRFNRDGKSGTPSTKTSNHRRHKNKNSNNKNSNSREHQNRGANAGSHSSGGPNNSANSRFTVGYSHSCALYIAMFYLIVVFVFEKIQLFSTGC